MAVRNLIRPKKNKFYKRVALMEIGEKAMVKANDRATFYNAIIAYKKDHGVTAKFQSVTSASKETVTFQRIS